MAMRVILVQRHYVAVRVVAGGRAVEGEGDGPVGERREFPAPQVERGSLFRSSRQNADGLDLPLGDRRPGLHARVVGAGAASADAQAPALSDVSVIRRAESDRALRRFVAQYLRLPPLPFLAKPIRDGIDDPLTRDGRRKETSIEEYRVWTNHIRLRIADCGLRICRIGSGYSQEYGQMFGDRRLAGVWQAEFAQAGTAFARGQIAKL